MQKLAFLFFMLFFLGLFVMPVYAQDGSTAGGLLDLTSIGMGLAAAGCAIAQSRALTAGCEGVARNPEPPTRFGFLSSWVWPLSSFWPC